MCVCTVRYFCERKFGRPETRDGNVACAIPVPPQKQCVNGEIESAAREKRKQLTAGPLDTGHSVRLGCCGSSWLSTRAPPRIVSVLAVVT